MKTLRKLVLVAYTFAVSMLIFGRDTFAYIDPSVMTYMIQIIAGIVVAVGAVAGIYFRKVKKKMSEKLGIDENRNKEVESDDIYVDEEDDD